MDKQPSQTFNQWKKVYNKNYLKNNKSNQSFATFQSFQSQLSLLIANLKNKYYSKVAKRLLHPSTSPKTYWSILKTFLNNKKIFHDNKFITDFKQKAEIFNPNFSKQCTALINNSKIPSECPRKLNESLSSITFEINDTEKVIKNLPWYAKYSHVETVWWIHLQTFEPYFQVLFRNWSISVWLEKKLMLSQFLKRVTSSYYKLSSNFFILCHWQNFWKVTL